MRTLGSLAVIAMLSSVAVAQPGMQTYEPQPQPAAVMQVQLTVDEQFLMERGYITPNQHIGGGLAAMLFGFGVGHAIQGRWQDRGWIFTIGDSLAGFAFAYGFVGLVGCVSFAHDSADSCDDDKYTTMLVGGLIAGALLRAWEVADAFIVPARHNARLTALRDRLGLGMPLSIAPYVVPVRGDSGGGGVAGVALSF